MTLPKNETEQVKPSPENAILDFASRILAVSDVALNAAGIDVGTKIMFYAIMAEQSGISREDLNTLYQKAIGYSQQFEQAFVQAQKAASNGNR